MLKKIQEFSIVVLLLVYFSGCSDNKELKQVDAVKSEIVTEPEQVAVAPEVEVPNESIQVPIELQLNRMQYASHVRITATTDSVTVEDVVGNRGNCQITEYHKSTLPKELKFGEQIDMVFPACNLIAVDVLANQNSWSFTF